MAYTADEIENAQDRAFEAPIPGMGLTTELGSRPWEHINEKDKNILSFPICFF